MSDILGVILLGAVQALTEFLPVSSSGHLALLAPLLGRDEDSLTFDVGLHAGTGAAVLAYFAKDWAEIAQQGTRDLLKHRLSFPEWSRPGRVGALIVVGTIPAVAVGLLFGELIEGRLREPHMIAGMLLLGAVAMALADRWGGISRGLPDLTLKDALVIGVAQAVALAPGVSRSGVTLTAARGLGFERASAVRFSFLLSTPVIIGAFLLQAVKTRSSDVEWRLLVIGAVMAFLLGLVAIRFLLAFVVAHNLMPFVWYRIGLAGAIFAFLILRS